MRRSNQRPAADLWAVGLAVGLAQAVFSTAPAWGQANRDLNWKQPTGAAAAVADPKAYDAQRAGTGTTASRPTGNMPAPLEPLRAIDVGHRPRLAKVTGGDGSLPNNAGQVWREYDIAPYTLRVANTERPEQALVDWILRETGYETWHGAAVTVLSADRHTLKVYHTPEVQEVVGNLVDRFVDPQAETHAFSMRVVSIDKPTWRSRIQGVMRPVPVETQGIEAWLMQKEDAARIMAEFQRRNDFREHGSPHLLVHNGQTITVGGMRPRNFVQSVRLRQDVWPGYETQSAQFDEGFTVELSPLASLDRRTMDAVLKCSISQVEKLHPVTVETASFNGPRQRVRLEVPQSCQYRVHERFRWPADQVLVIGLGMVPLPTPAESTPFLPVLGSPSRADLLILLESRGQIAPQPGAGVAAPGNYHGRY